MQNEKTSAACYWDGKGEPPRGYVVKAGKASEEDAKRFREYDDLSPWISPKAS